MELVEGEDLSQRIARGAIPLDEALPIAKQIAEALEAAHEQGIIHRDLKPANIKVRADGTVKVLDFGLAKATEASGSGLQAPGALSQSPTITTPAMTQAGMILGTAAYMSPEQAAGTPVDRRADIWAFGVVLWEMLSGQRLFGGDTVVHTLADVLRRSIEFDKLDVPAPIKTLLRRCLDRDAKTRLRDIGEARVAIAQVSRGPGERDDVSACGEARPSVGCLGRGGGSRRDRHRRVVAAAAGGDQRNGGGFGVDDRARGRRPHARRRPACNPRDLARRLCGDLLWRHRVVWYAWRASAALEHAHARTRAHRRFQKSRILVPRLAVVRVHRRDQPEEDARAGRRAGNCRKRCCHDGGRELERQRYAADSQSAADGPGLYAVPAAGGVAKRIEVTDAAERPLDLVAGVPAGQRRFSVPGSCHRERSRTLKSTSPRCATDVPPIPFC